MNFDRVMTTTTSTGTGNITVSTTPAAQCEPLSAITAGTTGQVLVIKSDTNGEWEESYCTVIDATTFSRDTVIKGSAGPGNKVNFSAGTKTVFATSSSQDTPLVRNVPFSTTIPLKNVGTTFMADYTMTGPLTLTAGASPVNGAHAVGAIIGDGVNTPAIVGAVKHGQSLAFNKAAGVRNVFEMRPINSVIYYAFGQAAADVVATTPPAPVDTTAPTLTSPTSASTGTTTGSGSVTTNEGNGTLYWIATTNATESVATVKGGSSVAVTSTGSKAVTVASLTASTTYYLHFVQTDTAANDSARVTSASFTTAAPGDTTAPTLSAPSATKTGANTATGSITTNEANGTLYYLASTNAVESAATVKAGASQAVTATGAQAVSFTSLPPSSTLYGHYVHRDAAGNDSTVANSASFVTDAGAPVTQYPRLTQFGSTMTEAGPAPYDYTKTGVGEASGVFDVGFGNNADGSITMQLGGDGLQAFALGLVASKQPVTSGAGAAQMLYAMDALYANGNLKYNTYNNGVQTTTANVRLTDQWVRITRTSGTFTFAFSNDGTAWTTLATFVGVTGAFLVQFNSGSIKDVTGTGLV